MHVYFRCLAENNWEYEKAGQVFMDLNVSYRFLLHFLIKIVTKCLVTLADTACDFKPISAHSCELI